MQALNYLIKQTISNIARGGWSLFFIVIISSISLLLLSMVLQGSKDIESIVKSIGTKATIMVYLNPNTDPNSLANYIKNIPNVASIEIIPKEVAWENMKKELAGSINLDSILDTNPLPDAIRVTVAPGGNIAFIADVISSQKDVVEDVRYGSVFVEKLEQISKFIQIIGTAISAFFIIAIVLLLVNTINLAIENRRDEIGIMQLVGATPAYIWLPFVLEGITITLTGAIIALVIMQVLHYYIIYYLSGIGSMLGLINNIPIMLSVYGTILMIAVVIGGLGSYLAVKKHMR